MYPRRQAMKFFCLLSGTCNCKCCCRLIPVCQRHAFLFHFIFTDQLVSRQLEPLSDSYCSSQSEPSASCSHQSEPRDSCRRSRGISCLQLNCSCCWCPSRGSSCCARISSRTGDTVANCRRSSAVGTGRNGATVGRNSGGATFFGGGNSGGATSACGSWRRACTASRRGSSPPSRSKSC
jgi:uncharacterized membrane protein YgcG